MLNKKKKKIHNTHGKLGENRSHSHRKKEQLKKKKKVNNIAYKNFRVLTLKVTILENFILIKIHRFSKDE